MRKSGAPSLRRSGFNSPSTGVWSGLQPQNIYKSSNSSADLPKSKPKTAVESDNFLGSSESDSLGVSEGSENIENACSASKINVIYTVVWGKQTTKKHKTYESDGTLEISEKSLVLKDEDGKIIGRSALKKEVIEEGSSLNVGSKSVQIVELASSTATQNATLKRPVEKTETVTFRPFKKAKKFSKVNVPIGESNDRGFQMSYESLAMPRPSLDHQWKYNDLRHPVTDVTVDPCLARVLRPHQRAGVTFLYECVLGMRETDCHGAILADEMGLGKTLQCITLVWLLLKQGPYGGKSIARRVLIVTPSSLVQNWQKEFLQWLGRERITTFVVDQKNKPKDFIRMSHLPIMIISYEMFVRYFEEIQKIQFDLLICDEGHRLKNTAIRTSALLSQLDCTRRVLLTGTPVQNDLQEFFALVNFVNPGILGTSAEFRREFEDPIVASRQPDIEEGVSELGAERAIQLNRLTNKFILRRTQEINDKYLPTKHESVVFCRSTPLQRKVYRAAIDYWFDRGLVGGGGVAHLGVITALKKVCNHPALVQPKKLPETAKAKTSAGRISPTSSMDPDNVSVEENLTQQLLTVLPPNLNDPTSAEHSGKLSVVVGLLEHLSRTSEKIVLVSYFTQTLDLFAALCDRKQYKYCRLDGSTPSGQRLEIVNRFNGPYSQTFVFLLSARAGGVGLNLVGASRLVLYDSDWNPATDLQAMARIWRDGQKRSVYIYRLLTAGFIEEKIFQRQISKTGLSGAVVDPHNPAAIRLSNDELKDLFTFHDDSECLTHDILDCHCPGDGSVPGIPEELPADEKTVAKDQDSDLDSLDGFFSSQRDCQLIVGEEKPAENQSLRMNQLYQWEHHAAPFKDEILAEMGLSNAAASITFMFRNSSTCRAEPNIEQ